MGHRAWGKTAGRSQIAAGIRQLGTRHYGTTGRNGDTEARRDEKSGERAERRQKTEIRRQKSGLKLISDLRLLTSEIDDTYDFNGFKDLPLTA